MRRSCGPGRRAATSTASTRGPTFALPGPTSAAGAHFVINGTHKSEKGNPPSTDPYQFGRAAEIAWTIYLFDQTNRQLEINENVLFNLKGNQWIRLGRGYMVVCTGGDEQTWPADEIALVNVDQGVVRIRRRDAKEGWMSSRGVFKFNFDSLANAQLFFHLCEKVVGVSVG